MEFIINNGKLISVQFTNEERYIQNDIVIPSGVTSIGEGAFACMAGDTFNIKSVVFPEGLIEINANAFRSQENLRKIIFPSTIKFIGKNAFFGIGEAEINILSNSEKLIIETDAFSFSSILSLNIESNSIVLCAGAFSYCKSLKKADLSKSTKAKSWEGIDIPDNCFEFTADLTDISLPAISSIGTYAFLESAIKSIVIAGSNSMGLAVKIKDSAFCNCIQLEKVLFTFPFFNGNVILQSNCFRRCISLREINLEVVSSIKNNAFFEAFSADAKVCLSFKNDVDIGFAAFAYSMVNQVDLSNVSKLSKMVFKGCKNLEKVILPQGGNFKSIPEGCFVFTEALEEIVFNDNIEVIENEAFAFSGIKSIILPKNLKNICSRAFYESKLESVNFSRSINIEHIDTAVFFNTNLSKVDLRQNVFITKESSFSAFDSNINVLYSYYSYG